MSYTNSLTDAELQHLQSNTIFNSIVEEAATYLYSLTQLNTLLLHSDEISSFTNELKDLGEIMIFLGDIEQLKRQREEKQKNSND